MNIALAAFPVAKAAQNLVGLRSLFKAGRYVDRACNCFVAGTEVDTPDGPVPIESIEEGDEILTRHQDRPEEPAAEGRVTRVFRDLAPVILWLTLANGEVIGATPSHEVWTHQDGWTAAGAIAPGDTFLDGDGCPVEIIDVAVDPDPTPVYNLEVDGTFTPPRCGMLDQRIDQESAQMPAGRGEGIMENKRAQDAALRERVKELTCLYSLAQLVERPGISLPGILQGTVELLPPAWQYPELTAGRIVFDGQPYVTGNFREGGPSQSAPIVVNGKPRGHIEAVYIEEMPSVHEGPFLKEERHLIDAMARQIALIIERKQAEEDRLRLQDQLRHADRLATIGQLAAGIAHELNEPLGNILGFAQLAQKHGGLPEGIGQDLAKIVATCLHARQIINSLLLFSRQTPPRMARVDLNVVAEEAIRLLEPRCARNGIAIVRHLTPGLPEIAADASQLRQVLVDLVVNAVHAMPDGGVLEVATHTSGDRVRLTVRDNGTGMSKEVIEKIFVPFFTTKDVNEGTGLGLPVVHGIVTSHGGTIRVESVPGQGTRFDIDLPLSLDTQANGDRMDDLDE